MEMQLPIVIEEKKLFTHHYYPCCGTANNKRLFEFMLKE